MFTNFLTNFLSNTCSVLLLRRVMRRDFYFFSRELQEFFHYTTAYNRASRGSRYLTDLSNVSEHLSNLSNVSDHLSNVSIPSPVVAAKPFMTSPQKTVVAAKPFLTATHVTVIVSLTICVVGIVSVVILTQKHEERMAQIKSKTVNI